jgi:hypothetical protein
MPSAMTTTSVPSEIPRSPNASSACAAVITCSEAFGSLNGVFAIRAPGT